MSGIFLTCASQEDLSKVGSLPRKRQLEVCARQAPPRGELSNFHGIFFLLHRHFYLDIFATYGLKNLSRWVLTGRRCRWFGKQCDINIKKRWQDAWAAKAEFTDDVNTCRGGFSLFSNSNVSFTPSYEAEFASLSLSSKSLWELWHVCVCVYLFFFRYHKIPKSQ